MILINCHEGQSKAQREAWNNDPKKPMKQIALHNCRYQGSVFKPIQPQLVLNENALIKRRVENWKD